MFGWRSPAAALASRRNRSTNRSSEASPSLRTFTATGRRRSVSSARQIVPIPPVATRSSSRYRSPSTVGGESLTGRLPGRCVRRTEACSSLSEGGLDHGPGDRGGHVAAGGLVRQVPPVQDHHRHGDRGVLGRREAHEPRVGRAGFGLGRAGLPRHRHARDLRGGSRPPLNHLGHDPGHVHRRLRRDGVAEHAGAERLQHAPVGVPDLLHQVRFHLGAAVGDGRGHQGHLQRVRSDVLLPDGRERDGREAVLEERGLVELPLVERDVERHVLIEPVRPRLVEQGLGPKLQAQLAERDVAGLDERVLQRDLRRAPGTVLASEVLQLLLGLGEVELVRVRHLRVEGEPVLQRGGEVDELERGPGREDLVGRIGLEQPSVVRVQSPAGVLLVTEVPHGDGVRVEPGDRHHGLDLAGGRVHGHHGAAVRRVVRELLERDLLKVRVDRGDHRGAPLGAVQELVFEGGGQQLRGPGPQEVVVSGLQPLPAALHREEAGDVGVQRPLGVPAEELQTAGGLHALGQDRALVGGQDVAPVHVELLDDQARVRRVVGDGAGVPHLDVVHRHEQHDEQRHHGHAQSPDLGVHRMTSVGEAASGSGSGTADGGGSRGRPRLRLGAGPEEIRTSSASRMKFETRLDPPYDTNGRVTPVSGITLVMPPTMMKAWIPRIVLSPAARSLPKPSACSVAAFRPLPTSTANSRRTPVVPITPSSSPIAAKMKSVAAYGMIPGSPWPSPVPPIPPVAMANSPWASWNPLSNTKLGLVAWSQTSTRSPPWLTVAIANSAAAANSTSPMSRYAGRAVATHSITTKIPKYSMDCPRSFSKNSTASATPHARSTGPRSLAWGRWNGPRRRGAIWSISLREFRKEARNTAMRTLPISAGWKVRWPRWIHTRAPLIWRPMPGRIGSSSRTTASSPIVYV